MASYLILLGTPRELNIPYFAMGAPSSRENRVVRLGKVRPSQASRSPCAAWLKSKKTRKK